MAAALPLAAQPKLLTNAKLDTRSAASLDREFRPLVTAQPQPAWIGYIVPAARSSSLGCESLSGVVHLEPPDQALILFRVEANAVTRIRTMAPDCAIDAGGVPVHWLSDVKPAESVALLATFVPQQNPDGNSALRAIASHAGPEALDLLISIARTDKDPRMRKQAMSSLGQSRDPRALAFFEDVLKR
jgi:hypothetical protein